MIVFFFSEGEPVIKATKAIAQPERFLSLLSSLDSSAVAVESSSQSPAESEGLRISGCVWMRGKSDQVLGGIALFREDGVLLDTEQLAAVQLLATNLQDLLAHKAALQESESFERIFNFSNSFVCVMDFQGVFEQINPSYTSILGWTRDKIIGQNFSSFIYPDDLEESNEIFGQLVQGQIIQNFVHRFLNSAGGFRIIQWTATPDLIANRIYAIGRDVTEEKNIESKLMESKLRMREVFENSEGLMCTHDLEGRFLTVNSAGASMVGYSREEVLEMSLFDLVPKEHHADIRLYLQQIQSAVKVSGQLYVRHKDGSIKTWIFNNVLHSPVGSEEAYVIGNAIDITSRAQLEKDLRLTRALLEETGNVARVGGWEVDLATSKVSWTPVTRSIHEVPEDFIPDLHEGINFYMEGESRDMISLAVQQAIQHGTPWNIDLQIVTARGNVIWVRTIGKAIQENGITVKLLGTFQDIDSEKIAELAAAAAKKLLMDVFDASSEVSVIATNTEGIITVFNRGAEKMLGYDAVEMIGRQSPTIIHVQEELEIHSQKVSAEFGCPVLGFDAIIARAERYGSEKKNWTYVCKDGDTRWVELVVTPIRDLDQVTIGYLGIALDVTEKRSIEIELNNERSRLTAFVKHTPAAVAMLDRDLIYLAVSDRWVREFKREESQVIGQSHYRLFENIVTQDSHVWHRKVMAGEVVGKEEEKVMLPDEDEPQYISWEMRPWYLYDGEIGGMMVMSQNVTGMVKRREELQVAKNKSEEASRAKSEFLANMSHEIRTPLNGVIGFTDLVLKTKLTDTQNQYLTIVNQSANALLGIINDILDFSKIEAGKLELDVERIDLYELASQATDIITYQIQKKGLELLLNVDAKLPRFIHSDSVRLKQVLVNLLGNASKFTDTGEIELKISALESVENQTTIRFEVRDTGIGIHSDKQKKIFEAFSQEDSSTTKKYGGTGLGLTISNKLLGLMGSTLQLHSKLGKGSTFYFDVVFTSEPGEPIEWEGLESIQHVLVVDDNENNRIIVSQMLRLKNIKTTAATNGFEALQYLASGKRFDVILMDYHMPFMDGIETVRKIQESFMGQLDDMPILLLHSSSDDQRILQACREYGIGHRLIKPLKIQELYHALSHLSEKPEPAKAGAQSQTADTREFSILIAEDNPVNMLLTETILINCLPHATLLKAENGLQAVEFCKNQAPDLIFMDVQMPVMNGYEATQLIRGIPACATVPILALTAGNVKGEKEKCLAIGMDDFVVKPVVEETLRQLLSKWLRLEEKEQDNEKEKMPGESVHFNPDNLKDYVGENAEFFQTILLIVKDELQGASTNLKEMRSYRDVRGLKELGHKLYGTAATSGFEVLANLTKKLENSAEWEELADGDLLNKILGEIQTVLSLLEEI